MASRDITSHRIGSHHITSQHSTSHHSTWHRRRWNWKWEGKWNREGHAPVWPRRCGIQIDLFQELLKRPSIFARCHYHIGKAHYAGGAVANAYRSFTDALAFDSTKAEYSEWASYTHPAWRYMGLLMGLLVLVDVVYIALYAWHWTPMWTWWLPANLQVPRPPPLLVPSGRGPALGLCASRMEGKRWRGPRRQSRGHPTPTHSTAYITLPPKGKE